MARLMDDVDGLILFAEKRMKMISRRSAFRSAAALGSAIIMSSAFAEETATRKPNVLFIAVDDLNDWVGYLGGHAQARTPNIDTLAKEGAAFTHAYCPAPICGPSRTALLYGIYPHRSGSYGHDKVYNPSTLLPKERLPLTLAFQKNGYYTAGCGKIFHYPEKRGWNEYRSVIAGKNPPKTGKHPVKDSQKLAFGIQDTENDSDTEDGRLTDWAIEQLQRNHEKPFFIALGLRKPHLPWDAPRKYYEQHDLETTKLPLVPETDLDDIPEAGKAFARSIVGFVKLDDHKAVMAVEGAWRELVRAYLATSSFADANVGRLLETLRKSPYIDNTLVVFWSDHGWHLGEKNHWRKMTLWERGTRTPFIIKMPGATANGKRIEAPVSLMDIYPTLVDLCGLKMEQKLDGNSLAPLLRDPSIGWHNPVLMSHGPGNFAVRKERWRLIRYADESEELYDMEKDPGEFVNLANDPNHNGERDELRKHVPTTWRYVMDPRFKAMSDLFTKPTVKKDE